MEVVSVQLGVAASHAGASFWNIQDEAAGVEERESSGGVAVCCGTRDAATPAEDCAAAEDFITAAKHCCEAIFSLRTGRIAAKFAAYL